ncbi:MAG: PD-(D/E)XK nuclease family transposase [Treponema sp.]|nr:PD-(D/E)XK nuclease family transposase [Treponema sp.]MEE3434091.1 PD-(D/E)XK nuclease family transposase [Treponema sp.]
MEKRTYRPSPTAILNPRLDVNFKALFTQGTKESDAALKSFISAAIGRKIKSLKLDPNEPAVDTPSQMQMSFDVAVTFDDGEKADIEIQGRDREYDFKARAEIQVARLLNNNAKKGGNYDAKKVFQISVLNFHCSRDDKSQVSRYTMKSQSGTELAGKLNVIFIDLLEIKKLVGTPVENLSPLQKWGLFFSYADDESKAEYISQIAESEEGIMEADRIAQKMSEDDANWFRQNSIDIARRDYNSTMEHYQEMGLEKGLKQGLEQGIQQGIAKGAQQKALETAQKLIADGKYTTEEISRLLGIPVEAFA